LLLLFGKLELQQLRYARPFRVSRLHAATILMLVVFEVFVHRARLPVVRDANP